MSWNRKKLIKAYIDFFKSKKHKEIPNASLIPINDPTVLFTTAGMHPLVPFLLGQPHPLGKRLVNVQKCIRTGDIDEVGNEYHHTFFEMLGNWSLGDYFKKEAIELSLEFLTKILKIPKEKLTISCFAGDKDAPKDLEAAKIWESLRIPKSKIKFLPKEDNWWGPAGKTGPCGPDTEMFVNKFEIWNDVFMQYNKDEKGNYTELKQKNVDTGMGVERTTSILNKTYDDYLTDSFYPIIKEIEKLSKKKYNSDTSKSKDFDSAQKLKISDKEETRAMRIIADHIKAAVFILNEKIAPSNTEQGYVLRRLIRRAVRYGKTLMMQNNFTRQIAEIVIKVYDDYNLSKNKEFILTEIDKEETRFRQSLQSGINFFNKIAKEAKNKTIPGKQLFLLYQSYGFPLEVAIELAKEKGLKINILEFEEEQSKHQKLSRTATEGRFKSGLADKSEETTKLHTATHLLLAALKQVLKQDIEQRGSNITAERLRFDFTFDRKLTNEELKQVEELVNKNIKLGLEVKREELSLEQAKKSGATGIFEHKYGDKVSIYSIKNCSKEICAGPHVTNTKQLGKFKILKEEASSAGVRRIKAKLE